MKQLNREHLRPASHYITSVCLKIAVRKSGITIPDAIASLIANYSHLNASERATIELFKAAVAEITYGRMWGDFHWHKDALVLFMMKNSIVVDGPFANVFWNRFDWTYEGHLLEDIIPKEHKNISIDLLIKIYNDSIIENRRCAGFIAPEETRLNFS